MSRNTDTQEYRELVSISQTLCHEYQDENRHWEGSPFEWIKYRPSRSIGAIGEKIVSSWLALHDFNVGRSPDSEADRVVENKRVEIKFSTQWKNGTYLFEQIRDQNYDFAIFLGVSPHDAHCWVVPKSDLVRMWKVEHVLSSQHGGAGGTDTAWARLTPDGAVSPDDVHFQQYGNKLRNALISVARMTGYVPRDLTEVIDG